VANNLTTRPGPNLTPPNPSGQSWLARLFKLLVRPVFIFIILALVVGLGALISLLAATGQVGKVATAPTAPPTVKPTPTLKAGAVPTATIAPSPTPDGIIKIFITGEVKKPGVYEMHEGDRIIDAVKVAGGFTETADQNRVDQAQRVRDEMRIEIPAKPPTPAPASTAQPGQDAAGNAVQGQVQVVPTATPADSRIKINTASAAELDTLPGIGAVLSQRILDYRTKNGPFHSLDDLRKVQGLSASEIEKIKDLIVFN
jgi:competence protein ComEA